jgi:hypothetical protein
LGEQARLVNEPVNQLADLYREKRQPGKVSRVADPRPQTVDDLRIRLTLNELVLDRLDVRRNLQLGRVRQ